MENFWQIATPIITALILGLGQWRIQVIISKSDKKREQIEDCREQYQIMLLKASNASICLGEATAKALRDGHTNGEVTHALDYAQRIKQEQHDWIQTQGVKKIM